jgi:hypothetical protein
LILPPVTQAHHNKLDEVLLASFGSLGGTAGQGDSSTATHRDTHTGESKNERALSARSATSTIRGSFWRIRRASLSAK